MTVAAIVAFYLLGLAAFLGMDILAKVPTVMLVFAVGGLSAVSAFAFSLPLSRTLQPNGTLLDDVGLALGGLAVGASITVMSRLAKAYAQAGSK